MPPKTQNTRWDRPGIVPVANEEQRAARRLEAERVLRRLEAAKNRGEDYELRDILLLRTSCMNAAGASLEARTVGARDAIYRAAVDAGIKSCLEPGSVDLGDYSPIRLAAGVASDVSLSERRAVSTLMGAVAGACRARIVEVRGGVWVGEGFGVLLPSFNWCLDRKQREVAQHNVRITHASHPQRDPPGHRQHRKG